jgi:hypothetical protein
VELVRILGAVKYSATIGWLRSMEVERKYG